MSERLSRSGVFVRRRETLTNGDAGGGQEAIATGTNFDSPPTFETGGKRRLSHAQVDGAVGGSRAVLSRCWFPDVRDTAAGSRRWRRGASDALGDFLSHCCRVCGCGVVSLFGASL